MKPAGDRSAVDKRIHARMLRAAARRAGLTVAQLRGGAHGRRNERAEARLEARKRDAE